MNITATAVAVTLAIIIAGAFLFFGPNFLSFFGASAPAAPTQTATTTSLTMPTSTPSDATNPSATAGPVIPSPLPTTLTVTDETVGTGEAAKAGDTVTVNYVGELPDGTVFDASANHGQAFSFQLGAGQVIPGWDQGVVGMKVGGKRELIIPANLAYGAQGAGNGLIPPNATLIFEVELVSIGQ